MFKLLQDLFCLLFIVALAGALLKQLLPWLLGLAVLWLLLRLL
jgi:hypothetical protein